MEVLVLQMHSNSPFGQGSNVHCWARLQCALLTNNFMVPQKPHFRREFEGYFPPRITARCENLYSMREFISVELR